MVYGQNRNQMRQFFINVWRKANAADQPPLEPLEKLVATVIEQHPEYQAILASPDVALGQEFLPESGHSNPFLHMSMHIAIQEQLGSRRPDGINSIWAALASRHNSLHEAEMLWQAQRTQQEPDQSAYLRQLRTLVEK